MKFRALLLLAVSFVPIIETEAQETTGYFHSVGVHQRKEIQVSDSVRQEAVTNIQAPDSLSDQEIKSSDFSSLSIEELEMYIKKYEGLLSKAADKTTNQNNDRILSYYNGESHPLTLANVMQVAEEQGLSNLLFVLAQAILETGHFKSRVCLEYHNLFGLYDSRRQDYYHFARWEDSVIGYKKFIQYRYKGGNYLMFLRRIGYAEDPGYTAKVGKIAMRLYEKIKKGELNQ